MSNDQEPALRVKRLREKSGMSVREVARQLGMSTSGYLHYETPSRFKGPYLPLQIANQLVEVLSAAKIPAAEVMALAGVQDDKAVRADVAAVRPGTLVPVYDVQASAGFGAIVDSEEHVASLAFPSGYLRRLTRANPRDLKIITVKGDSMAPTLNDDDVVMLDVSKRDLSYDGLFVVRDNGDGLLVKRVGRATRSGHITLISDNRVYLPVERATTEIEVIGKVIWHGRKV